MSQHLRNTGFFGGGITEYLNHLTSTRKEKGHQSKSVGLYPGNIFIQKANVLGATCMCQWYMGLVDTDGVNPEPSNTLSMRQHVL